MTPVFLDTVGLIALWDEDNQWHEPANTAFDRLTQQTRVLVVTTLVLYECGNATARRPYRVDVDDLREQMKAQDRLVEPTEADLTAAWTAYRAGHAGEAGIVDHVSFAVMRRLGLVEAFTNDRHFAAAGFIPLF
ncbi:MAG: type II toxin-antitoxin system VapC family toxin [Zavarzinella sp.]|nr:type II toxin-antitoxin system VapC family toxin [Zavarzinella sp.]